jgi:hypothetical protein
MEAIAELDRLTSLIGHGIQKEGGPPHIGRRKSKLDIIPPPVHESIDAIDIHPLDIIGLKGLRIFLFSNFMAIHINLIVSRSIES